MTAAVECPHPDCKGQIKIGSDLPAGVYDCICRTVEVRLEWSPSGPTLSLSGPARYLPPPAATNPIPNG